MEYARSAGKNRGENRGWDTPSFSTGQPGILVEMTGVKQPISRKRVTYLIKQKNNCKADRTAKKGNFIAQYFGETKLMWARPVTWQQIKGYSVGVDKLPCGQSQRSMVSRLSPVETLG